jgi:hypothetical protein
MQVCMCMHVCVYVRLWKAPLPHTQSLFSGRDSQDPSFSLDQSLALDDNPTMAQSPLSMLSISPGHTHTHTHTRARAQRDETFARVVAYNTLGWERIDVGTYVCECLCLCVCDRLERVGVSAACHTHIHIHPHTYTHIHSGCASNHPNAH